MRLVLLLSPNVLKVLHEHEQIDQYEVTVINGSECSICIDINRNPRFLHIVTESDECIPTIKKYDVDKTKGYLGGLSYDFILQKITK